MKILIIEDEPLVAKDLERLIKEFDQEVSIIAVLPSVSSSKQWFLTNTLPDLIFSDVRLSDGISFEIFESMDIRCPIIFSTAYDEYAIRAFKLNSIDYLLKPVDRFELHKAFVKYKSLQVGEVLSEQLKTMLTRWSDTSTKKFKERFLTLHRNSLVPVQESEISFFKKEELIHLHTVTGEKYLSEHQTLDEIEGLVNPEKFFRVNRQFLVHIQVIGKIKTTHKGLTIELKGSPTIELDISREKATVFKNWIA